MESSTFDKDMEFFNNYLKTRLGLGICGHCGKKLGIFGGKEIYLRFGLTHKLCKECYREYKIKIKEIKKS